MGKLVYSENSFCAILHLPFGLHLAHTYLYLSIPTQNERLFHEMYEAYSSGRLGKDPLTFWYSGELGFFDHYVIPLAKKLKECNVFGVSCDEFLDYAEANRSEWNMKGEEIVKGYAARYCQNNTNTTLIEE